ncbi:MAG TPA: aminopeptidase P family protein [Acidimicrobiales bacterium]|nr:aminopeptidase P family protein [Acidimicrobiales bacterium]
MPSGRDHSNLAAMDVASRLGRLRTGLGAAGCDALLVTSLVNVRYLTGFTGSAAMLLVTAGGALLLTDPKYPEQAAEQIAAAGAEVEIEAGTRQGQLEILDRATKGLSRLGLEAAALSWAAADRLRAELGQFASAGGELVATEGVVEGLRVVKDAGELARIELAADVADVALAQVKERLGAGLTEAEFALELDYEMRRRGADDLSFETIVASGPNGAMPHARPSDRRIDEGDVVVVDFGALVDGYHSDMTRSFTVGRVPEEMVEVLDAVFVAQRAGVRATRAGASASEVDDACRRSLVEAGYGEHFVHGTGHGVGLEIHEAPAISGQSADILDEGAVVTVEPGVYLPGTGGVRIEDTLVVTAQGARPLTKSTKDTTF